MSDRPKVVLDLRMVRGVPHGIARYAGALARHLPAAAPDFEVVAFTAAGAQLDAVPGRPCIAPFLSPLEQIELPARLVRERPALFHATSFAVPRWCPCPLVLTLHDAIHLAVPEESNPLKRTYYRTIVRPAALRARAILTVSRFARDELARHLGIDPARFTVIPNGVDERFAPPDAAAVAAVRARYGLPERFALYVGNLKPHKNVELLVRAARALQGAVPVVIAGDDAAPARLGIGPADGIRSLGSVPDADLPAVYGACTAFVFPSRYEGAGLPPLEAIACGAPVLASNAASMPEVLGDAAAFFAPDDAEALARLVGRVVADAAFRADLVRRGRSRAAAASWEACARRTADVYRSVLG